ncbi:hypothetical protein ABPG75_009939 [Micractinium tetrahymenae]
MRPQARGPTLVVYVFSGTDPEYADNLRFFIDEAVKADDGCEYIIVLQQGARSAQPDPLPPLPPNARYLPHPNKCYDLGTVGWVLDQQASLSSFAYVVWLNSSARGPFLPAYLRGRMHWTEPLLSKLTDSVKLVGAAINCGGAWGKDSHDATAHVQSYLVATDAVGLGVLRGSGSVLRCIDDKFGTVLTSEIGASTVILEAGYNIDSLMMRYQGVDWRDVTARQLRCNGAYDPVAHTGWNAGINVDPLEVMFVKIKGYQRAAGWPHVQTAIKFAEWMRLQPGSPEWLPAVAAGP